MILSAVPTFGSSENFLLRKTDQGRHQFLVLKVGTSHKKMSTGFNWKFTLYLLVVSIHFKNISQIMSNWKSSPSRSENKKSVKPPPTVAIYLCEIKCAHSQFCDFQLGFKNTLFSGPKNPVWTEMRAKLGNPHEVKVCFCTACKKSCQGKRLISLLHV